MADDEDRLAGAVDLLQELLRLLLDAQRVAVDDAAGEEHGVEVVRVRARQRELDLQLVRLVQMFEALNLALLWRDQHALRACFLECQARTGELDLLYAVRRKDCHTPAAQLFSHGVASLRGGACNSRSLSCRQSVLYGSFQTPYDHARKGE